MHPSRTFGMYIMRNSVAIGLIAISTLLLLVLQAFWLKNSYESAYFILRREGSSIFRNTVFQLRDSVAVNTIQAQAPAFHGVDSVFTFMGVADPTKVRRPYREGATRDSLTLKRRASTVQVFISSDDPADSLVKSMQPIARRLQTMGGHDRTFTIRIAPDSLNVDSLTTYFKRNLEKQRAGVNVYVYEIPTDFAYRFQPFAETWRPGERDSVITPILFLDTLKLETVRLNPTRRYAAAFFDIQPVLLGEIAPQIAFSVVLTVTIVAAFLVMYRTLRSQQRLMELKNDFISNMTHELKTPVATVSVALEALQHFDGAENPERRREYIAIAQQELHRLTVMTDKVLKTTLFEEQGQQFVREAVNLEQVVSDSIASMSILIEKAKATVSSENSGDDFTILGSAIHLTSMVTNLIENSLKYSTGTPHIRITLRQEAGEVVLSVADNGIGIPGEYHSKIFEKFFRVPTGDVHTVKGYGLGLSYVASIVKAHGGHVAMSSQPGEGSTFTIRFPRA